MDVVTRSLLWDEADTVRRIKRTGFDFRAYLTRGRLEDLYGRAVKFRLGNDISAAVGHFVRGHEADDPVTLPAVHAFLEGVFRGSYSNKEYLSGRDEDTFKVGYPQFAAILIQHPFSQDPYEELFTWCLVCGKNSSRSKSGLLWAFLKWCESPVAAAVCAAAYFGAMVKYKTEIKNEDSEEERDLRSAKVYVLHIWIWSWTGELHCPQKL